MKRYLIGGGLALAVIANAVVGYYLYETREQVQSMPSLESEVADLETENDEQTSDISALENASGFDASEITDQLNKLQRQVRSLRQDVAGLGEVDSDLAEIIDDNYEFFDQCVDDLLALINGDRPDGGSVC